jgi:hypothetical protein
MTGPTAKQKRDLFLAILSMDSYNRGYDVGIKAPESDAIGTAQIVDPTQLGVSGAQYTELR